MRNNVTAQKAGNFFIISDVELQKIFLKLFKKFNVLEKDKDVFLNFFKKLFHPFLNRFVAETFEIENYPMNLMHLVENFTRGIHIDGTHSKNMRFVCREQGSVKKFIARGRYFVDGVEVFHRRVFEKKIDYTNPKESNMGVNKIFADEMSDYFLQIKNEEGNRLIEDFFGKRDLIPQKIDISIPFLNKPIVVVVVPFHFAVHWIAMAEYNNGIVLWKRKKETGITEIVTTV